MLIIVSVEPLFASNTQVVDTAFVNGEKRISKLVSQLIEVRFDDAKLDTLSKQVLNEFSLILQKNGSFEYPFDSILPVGKVVSDDKLLRIFTWFAIRSDGSHIQFGIIQYYSNSQKRVLLYPLTDKSNSIENPQSSTLTHDNWYGATYFDIVQSKNMYGQTYVLLGWDGNNIYTKKKLVESLVFSDKGIPKFGIPVFVMGREKFKRVIFEYSRFASMMLKYDDVQDIIVMDHLSPSKPVYDGNRQFYGPDLSFDALKNENGLWIYQPTIDYKPRDKKKRYKKHK